MKRSDPQIVRGQPGSTISTDQDTAAAMVPESDSQDVAGEKAEVTNEEQITGVKDRRDRKESMEENLERLAALNLSNDQSLQPRFSTSIIRLVSALAGIGTLVLIYFMMKLFI